MLRANQAARVAAGAKKTKRQGNGGTYSNEVYAARDVAGMEVVGRWWWAAASAA